MSKPLIIAVEGTDKAGKRTQVTKIMSYLRAKGIASETLDFPQYNSFWGKEVKKYLNGEYGDIKNVPGELVMNLYANDRRNHQGLIHEWLDTGKWVVFDRYSYSNLFSVAKYPEELWDEKIAWLEEMEFVGSGLIRPDYNIYLYLDPNISYEMRFQGMKNYQNGKPDLHESNLKLLTDVSHVYNKVAQKDPARWTVVDEMDGMRRLSIDEVFEKIRERLDQLILDNARCAL